MLGVVEETGQSLQNLEDRILAGGENWKRKLNFSKSNFMVN